MRLSDSFAAGLKGHEIVEATANRYIEEGVLAGYLRALRAEVIAKIAFAFFLSDGLYRRITRHAIAPERANAQSR